MRASGASLPEIHIRMSLPPPTRLPPPQLVKGNNFAGSVFGAYGCFWCNLFFFLILESTNVIPSVNVTGTTGYSLWLCLWGTLTIGFGIFTLRMNGCMQVGGQVGGGKACRRGAFWTCQRGSALTV